MRTSASCMSRRSRRLPSAPRGPSCRRHPGIPPRLTAWSYRAVDAARRGPTPRPGLHRSIPCRNSRIPAPFTGGKYDKLVPNQTFVLVWCPSRAPVALIEGAGPSLPGRRAGPGWLMAARSPGPRLSLHFPDTNARKSARITATRNGRSITYLVGPQYFRGRQWTKETASNTRIGRGFDSPGRLPGGSIYQRIWKPTGIGSE